MVTCRLRNNGYYIFEGFGSAKVLCAFSTRLLGNMSLAYGSTQNSLKNRQGFLGALGVNYQDLVCAKQVHAARVEYVGEKDRGKGVLSHADAIDGTDALITDVRGVPLAVFSADCLSVFLYDPVKQAIGLTHAGWRSSKEKIAAKTVRAMQERFSTNPKDLLAALGPAIRSCCYEVSADLQEFFPAHVSEKKGHYYLDLAAENKHQLLSEGIKEENILDCEICTVCQNDKFFSFRKEGVSCGRMMSVMALSEATT